MPLIVESRRLWGPLALITAMSCVIISPLCFGAVHPNVVAFFTTMAMVALSFHIIERKQERRRLTTSWIMLPLLLGVLFAFGMLLPLPEGFRALFAREHTQLLRGTLNLLPTDMQRYVLPVLSWEPAETSLRILQLLGAVALFIVISDRARNKPEKKLIYHMLLLGGFLLVATSFGHRLLGETRIWGMVELDQNLPIYGPMINRNNMARLYGMYSLLCLSGGLLSKERVLRFWFFLVSILCGASVYLTLSRGGMIFFTAALLLLSLVTTDRTPNEPLKDEAHTAHRSHRTLLIALTSLLAILVSFYVANEAIINRLATLQNPDEGKAKTGIYVPAFSLIKDNWLTGTGQGGLLAAFHRYVNFHDSMPNALTSSFQVPFFENIFIQTFSDHGFIKGLLLYAVCLAIGWVLVRQTWHRRESRILLVALAFVVCADVGDFALETGSGLWLATVILALSSVPLLEERRYILQIPPISASLWCTAMALCVAVASPYAIIYDVQKPFSLENLNSEEKIRVLQNQLAHHPFNAELANKVAIFALAQKDEKTAWNYSEQAIRLWPTLTSARLSKARIWAMAGKVPEALQEYRLAWLSLPAQGPSIMAEVAKVVPDPQLQIQVVPANTAEALAIFCEQLGRDNHKNLVEDCFDEAASMPDASPALRIKVIEVAFAVGNVEGAYRRMLAELHRTPLDGSFAVLAANILEVLHGPRRALATSDTWLTEAKSPEALLNWQLNKELEMGLHARAWDTLKRLQNSTTISVNALAEYEARIYMASSQYGKALQVVQRLVNLNPQSVGLLLWRGRLELNLNMYDQAQKTHTAMSSLEPGNKDVQSFGLSVKEARDRRLTEGLLR